MLVRIFTAYPEYFDQSLSVSLLGKTRKDGLWNLEIINLRDFGIGKHKKIDDTSYGGGNGLILRPDVLSNAIEASCGSLDEIKRAKKKILITSPVGEVFSQKTAQNLAQEKEINIICNRFEGVDQRVIDYYQITPISIGKYVLLGGEVAACVILESTLRLLDGFLKNNETIHEESFSENLAGKGEYPQYTKPDIWNEIPVPNQLKSGNHEEIKKWRMKNLIELC